MNLSGQEFTRLANNFYNSKNLAVDYGRIPLDADLINYIYTNQELMGKKFKVAFCWICLNSPYWDFARQMVEGAKQYFLPGHQVDYFVWSDMPTDKVELPKLEDKNAYADGYNDAIEKLGFQKFGATIFPTEPQPWPQPTLLRYHLFLQQEEILKTYDYIFYCDVDMRFVGIVGDEILGNGLTVAPHPGYYIRKELYPPLEPNKESHAFVKRPGFVMNDEGKPRWMPYYAAGGLQGGRSDKWIKAMKVMKELVDKDMAQGYTPIWNDETVWNKYLWEVLPKKELEQGIFLTPSYIYPDSLIKEYYEPIVWGQSFPPKLITLTKKFSTSAQGGADVARMIKR